MSHPESLPAFGSGRIAVTPRIWEYFYKEALEQKAWAEGKKEDAAWYAGACNMSRDMLRETLTKSSERLAIDSLRYVHMRAVMGYGYKNQTPIDSSARDKWLSLGGAL